MVSLAENGIELLRDSDECRPARKFFQRQGTNISTCWSNSTEDIENRAPHITFVSDLNCLPFRWPTQNIANNYDTYGHLITRDANGLIESVDERPQNLSKLKTQGIDLAMGYTVDLDAAGELAFNFSSTFLQIYETQSLPTSAPSDQIASTNVPTFRANLATTWKVDDALSTTLFIQHIGSMRGINYDLFEGDTSYGPLEIKSYTIVNLSAKYEINDQFTVRGGINNIADTGPNSDTTEFGWPHYPREYYSPVGREFHLSLNMEF